MEKKIVDADGVAGYLSISKDGVYAMVHERKIPYFKVGRRVRFDLVEVNSWLEQRKKEPLQ